MILIENFFSKVRFAGLFCLLRVKNLMISTRFTTYFSAFMLGVGFPYASSADERNYTSHIALIGEYHDLHFVELMENGDSLNEEKGTLWFTGGGFQWQFANGLFTEAIFKQAEESLVYRGYTNLGQFVTTETEYYISDLSFLLGRDFGPTGAFIGVNRNYRERNVLGNGGVKGIYEELDVLNGVFGMRAALFRHKPLHLRLEARIATALDSSLYFNDGDLDPINVEPGKQMTYRVSAELFYNPVSRLVLSLIPAYEYSKIEESKQYEVFQNGRPTGLNSQLPATEWESYSLTGKVSWYF